jgi:hypothetical protein
MNWDRHDIADCEHLAINDGDDIVCTHCGVILSLTGKLRPIPEDGDYYTQSIIEFAKFMNPRITEAFHGPLQARRDAYNKVMDEKMNELLGWEPPDVIVADQERGM